MCARYLSSVYVQVRSSTKKYFEKIGRRNYTIVICSVEAEFVRFYLTKSSTNACTNRVCTERARAEGVLGAGCDLRYANP